MSGSFIYRHHVEPRVKLYSSREKSFPVPLKYIDVSRTTHTNLDVKQERRIDDYWNIDGSRDLSNSWTGFTQFTLSKANSQDGYRWSGWRLTRKQLTSRPDHLCPELWDVKEGTSAVLLQSDLGNEWWTYSMKYYCYLRNIQDLLSDGQTSYERRFGTPFNGPVIPFGAMDEHYPISAEDIWSLHQFDLKSCQVYSLDVCCPRRISEKET